MPAVADTCYSPPPIAYGWCSASVARSAIATASRSLLRRSAQITNSLPPSRATVSDARATRLQPVGDLHHQLVGRRRPEVAVDEDQPDRISVAARRLQRVRHPLEQHRPVGQPGEAVARLVELPRHGDQAGVAAVGQDDPHLLDQLRITRRSPSSSSMAVPRHIRCAFTSTDGATPPAQGAEVGESLRLALVEALHVGEPAGHLVRGRPVHSSNQVQHVGCSRIAAHTPLIDRLGSKA